MKKIMAKENIEVKAQNQTLQTKMRENQEKNEEDVKILCKAKKELHQLRRTASTHAGHIKCTKHK